MFASDRQKLVKMYESVRLFPDWRVEMCISRIKALIHVLTCKESMRTQVECVWPCRGTVKGFPCRLFLFLQAKFRSQSGVITEDSNNSVDQIIRPIRFPCNSTQLDDLHIHLLRQQLLYCEYNHTAC